MSKFEDMVLKSDFIEVIVNIGDGFYSIESIKLEVTSTETFCKSMITGMIFILKLKLGWFV